MRILHHHPIFKDVFREVGILEVMVTCLHRFAALLKEPTSGEGILLVHSVECDLHSVVNSLFSGIFSSVLII